MNPLQSAKPGRGARNVVFVSFESEFAPLGGLAAVMRLLPRRMAQLEKQPCFTMTPFFRNITRCNAKRYQSIQPTGKTFKLRFGPDYHKCAIFQHCDAQGFTTYLLDSEYFFDAPCDCGNPPAAQSPCNPYHDPARPGQLLRDALFFCAAIPRMLVALGLTENLYVSLQDWQTASAAFTIKQDREIVSAACTLTIHNPYDQPLSHADLLQICRRTLPGATVLTKMLPFVDGPICTVSENFATELIHDPLHSDVYAPHLQTFFRKRGIKGIDNGLFAKLSFPEPVIDAARRGDFQPILVEKKKQRDALVRVLTTYQPQAAWGTLDNLAEFEGPIFLCFGRDDPRQKGYDVAAAAIRKLPLGKAKYVFTPIPGIEGLKGLGFLKDLAEERPGEVKVFPFRMEQGYMELQKGCSYLAMCSLYEPFGGATEGYAVGTPVVARATGGLIQQVAPYPGGSMSHAVRWRADHFHARNASPTGFLFREPDLARDDVVAGWQHIVACAYAPNGDRVGEREGVLLFDEMVREAAWAFSDAIDLYDQAPMQYARMIASGFEMLQRFSWDRAVRDYQRLYDFIARL